MQHGQVRVRRGVPATETEGDLSKDEIDEIFSSVAVGVEEASGPEGWRIFDEAAQRYLHMSGEAFLEGWRDGKFEHSERPEVLRVVLLIPFAGQQVII